MAEEKLKYWDCRPMVKTGAQYILAYGERSNGKTYSVLEYALEQYFKCGACLGIIRRYDLDFVGANSARTCYNSLMCNGYGENVVKKLSKGLYDGVEYYSGKFYLTQKDAKTEELKRTDKIVAYGFGLSVSEHYKSGSWPSIKYILFDEFISRDMYLRDEFILFENMISTIVRARDDVTIFMCANTISKYGCIYWDEMGLYKIKQHKAVQGEIDIYTYGDSGLMVATQWTDGLNKSKPSDKLFAFNNPKLKMITSGQWEMNIYPHCPVEYRPMDIVFTYFIKHENQVLQCEVILIDNSKFTFIHRKTTPIKDEDNDLIYTLVYNPKCNYVRNITRPQTVTQRVIWSMFSQDRVYYQDNDVGELVRSYLQACGKMV